MAETPRFRRRDWKPRRRRKERGENEQEGAATRRALGGRRRRRARSAAAADVPLWSECSAAGDQGWGAADVRRRQIMTRRFALATICWTSSSRTRAIRDERRRK